MTSDRYSDRPFPPYAYRPGRSPHPLRSPAGHLFGVVRPPVTFSPADGARAPEFRFAVDLYNHGYFWEAHELWEALWHALERRGPYAALLQGLIQTAAAHIKTEEGRIEGVALLWTNARKNLALATPVADSDGRVFGVRVQAFIDRAERWFSRTIADRAAPKEKAFPAIEII